MPHDKLQFGPYGILLHFVQQLLQGRTFTFAAYRPTDRPIPPSVLRLNTSTATTIPTNTQPLPHWLMWMLEAKLGSWPAGALAPVHHAKVNSVRMRTKTLGRMRRLNSAPNPPSSIDHVARRPSSARECHAQGEGGPGPPAPQFGGPRLDGPRLPQHLQGGGKDLGSQWRCGCTRGSPVYLPLTYIRIN